MTSAPSRARLEQAEQQSYDKLLAALSQEDRVEAKVTETAGDVKHILTQTDEIKGDVAAIKSVVQGVPLQTGTPQERIAAANTSIAILALARKGAKADEKKDAAVVKKEATAAAKKAAALAKKKAAAAAKKAAALAKKKAAAEERQRQQVLEAVHSVSRRAPKRARPNALQDGSAGDVD